MTKVGEHAVRDLLAAWPRVLVRAREVHRWYTEVHYPNDLDDSRYVAITLSEHGDDPILPPAAFEARWTWWGRMGATEEMCDVLPVEYLWWGDERVREDITRVYRQEQADKAQRERAEREREQERIEQREREQLKALTEKYGMAGPA